MPDTDAVAAELAAIRRRAEQHIFFSLDADSCDLNGETCTGHDAEHLLAGYDALLKLATGWEAESAKIWASIELQDCDGASAGFRAIGAEAYRNRAKDLRETISAALLGEEADRG
jgi:hypothetical protein